MARTKNTAAGNGDDSSKVVAIFVRVAPEVHAKMKKLAVSAGLAITDAVRRIIEDALEDGWTPAASMARKTMGATAKRDLSSARRRRAAR